MKNVLKNELFSRLLLLISVFLCSACIVIFALCEFYGPDDESYKSNLYVQNLNDDWLMTVGNGEPSYIDLPQKLDIEPNETIVLKRKLPDNIADHDCLKTRSSRQNMRIYIGGVLRQSYQANKLHYFAIDPPSTNIFVELSPLDAGQTVRIEMVCSSQYAGRLNEVKIGSSSSLWFIEIEDNSFSFIINVLIFLMGLFMLVSCLAISTKLHYYSNLIYLSLGMIDVAGWGICESRLRPLLFRMPSVPGVLVFVFLCLMAIPVFTYWNNIQKKRYAAFYNAVNIYLVVLCITLLSLFALKKADMFSGLNFIIAGISAGTLILFVTTIIEAFRGNVNEYSFSAAGLLVVTMAALVEIMSETTFTRPFAPGTCLSISFLFFLLMSIIQGLHDFIKNFQDQVRQKDEITLKTIKTIAGVIDAKDKYTGGHSYRVAVYASKLAEALGKDKKYVDKIYFMGLMHDIGKIGIPDMILNKNAKLSDDEYRLMRQHTVIGAQLLNYVENLDGLGDAVRFHHERYDGKGYPDGLKAEQIPEIARILCVADTYDVMTSNRVYRDRLTDEAVREELLRNSGTQFDPAILNTFLRLIDSGELKPLTEDGFEIDTNFDCSTLITFQRFMQANPPSRPEFLRMVVYLMKMNLAGGIKQCAVIFSASAKNKTGAAFDESLYASELLSNAVSPFLGNADISTVYAPSKRFVLLIGASAKNSKSIIESIKDKFMALDENDEFVFDYRIVCSNFIEEIEAM